MSVTIQEIRALLDRGTSNITVADVNIMLRLAKDCGYNSVSMVNRCEPVIREIVAECFTEAAKDNPELASLTHAQINFALQGVYIPAIEQATRIFFDAGLKLHHAKASPQEIAKTLNSVQEQEVERVVNEAVKKLEKKASTIGASAVDIVSNAEANPAKRLGQIEGLIRKEIEAAFSGVTLKLKVSKPQLTAFNAHKVLSSSESGPKSNNTVGTKPRGLQAS